MFSFLHSEDRVNAWIDVLFPTQRAPMRTLLRGLKEPGGSEHSKRITMVKPNYFLSGSKTELDAFRTEIKSGYCVKYEETFHAMTSSLYWVCDSLRGERSGKLETFKVLRLPPLTLDETVMYFWDVKWSSRFG